jgi:hypothetical protein
MTTPIYGLPYQLVSSSPNGAVLGQGLATAVEAELARIDAAEAALAARLLPVNNGWTTYTPVVTCISGGNPTGQTVSGRWRALDSYLIIAQWMVTFAATAGGGDYLVSLPFSGSAAALNLGPTGTAHLLDVGVAEYSATCTAYSTDQVRFYSNSGVVSSTSPFTFGVNDVVNGQLIYERV